ncbi:MAG: DUF11 domain-containing protein, partial [Anaerolineae bacterium]|nr:DUF11 domain-containing protein [Anaerolineae bacterium]
MGLALSQLMAQVGVAVGAATLATVQPPIAEVALGSASKAQAETQGGNSNKIAAAINAGAGVLTITKVISGSGSGPFNITVTGPNGYNNATTVDVGSPRVLTGLDTGVYTVTESTPSGWTTSYSVTTGSGYATGSSAVVTVANVITAAAVSPGLITGTVFIDVTGDGLKSTNAYVTETGVMSVTVTAYNKDGACLPSTQTDVKGVYTFTSPSCQGPWRLEFSDLPIGYYPSKHGSVGATNSTSVQFVNSVPAQVNFGVMIPNYYYPAMPAVAIPVMHTGASVNQTSVANDFAYVSLPYSSTGDATGVGDMNVPDFTKDVAISDLGSVWGAGYQRASGRIFTGAALKRLVDLGPLVRPATGAGVQAVPVDGIYMLNYGGDMGGTFVGGFRVSGVTPASGNAGVINTGVVSREIRSSAITTANPYALSTTTDDAFDSDAFDKVGKVGFGDVEVSEDGNYLWAVNLNQRSLIRIDIRDWATLPTTGTINGANLAHYNINFGTLPSCSGEYRPWALHFRRGFGYLGVVCDANSSAHANLRAYVLQFDPSNPVAFTSVLTVNLDPATYKRESAQYGTGATTCALGTQQGWNRWATSWSDLGVVGENDPTYGRESACPQPILSAIEFDTNGDMMLGFMDRTTMQLDRANYSASTSDGTSLFYSVDGGGDIVHVCSTASGYVVEGFSGCVIDSDTFGTAGSPPSTRPLTNDGPNGVGEFYYQDHSTTYTAGNARHVENTLGSINTFPGSGEIMVSTYDTIGGDFNQGFHWYRTRTAVSGTQGSRSRQYQLVPDSAPASNLGSKGMRLGDIELLAPAAPIEIGNRVWEDVDGNGVQDPGEMGLSGVPVTLTWAGGSIATVTGIDGNYYFTREATTGAYSTTLAPNKAYTIQFGVPSGYDLTTTDAEGVTSNHAISDVRDSDATAMAGIPTINYTTGDYGQNNHGLDVGFTRPAAGAVQITNVPPVQKYDLGNRVWIDTNNNGIVDGSETAPSGTVTVTLRDSSGNVYTTTTDGSGYYKFENLDAGSYTVTLPASNFLAGGALAGYASSTGSSGTYTNTDNNRDHGIDVVDPSAAGVTSAKVIIGSNDPLGEDAAGPATTNGDASNNLTVDFGFWQPVFDLALKKTLDTAGPFVAGQSVTFTIEISNQGNVTGTNIVVVDYIPTGLILADSNWTAAGGVATKNAAIASLAPGASTSVKIAFTIDNGFSGAITNTAEISAAVASVNGYNGQPLTDKDSTPDNTNNDTVKDDVMNEDGKANPANDEDDHDIATLTVNALPKYDLGNRVWIDADNDGVFDAGEAAPTGPVTVVLYNHTIGTAVMTTTTDASGYYTFTNLDAGSYDVFIPASNFGAGQPLANMLSSIGA